MRVIDFDGFTVYVYREIGQPHHLPHCHVRWEEHETVVALPTLRVLAGSRLPQNARRFLVEHMEEIYASWNRLNQE